jgi:glycosyltransferase involved in cell wall biosynthesis
MVNEEKKINIIIPARNECNFLGSTLAALKQQTLQPHRILVVNDGSTDNTHEIALKYNVEVIDLEDRGFRATGWPILADVINKGLENISDDDCLYVMILGADHIIPPDYISKIVQIMEENDSIVIASGVIRGESQRDTAPRGSGRIIKYEFWKKLGLRYPSWYGFESYIVYKALVDSYQVRVVRDAISWSQRPTGKTTNYRSYGKAMQALGYHPLYALGRIILTFKNNQKDAIQMIFGYFDLSIKKYDIASDVGKLQFNEIIRKIKSKFKLNLG